MPYLPRWLVIKNLPASAGDTGSIPGLGRFPGVGIGNPLQYSCLEDPMGRGAWQATAPRVAKSWTRLSTHAWLGLLSGWRSSFLFLVYLKFCHERVLDFVRCLFCVYWDDHMVPFAFFFWNTVYWLMILMLNQSCIPGMNHTQLLCFILLSAADFQLLGYYWGCFHLYSFQDSHYASVGEFDVVLQVFEALLVFLYSFFVLYAISVDILSSLLIVSPGRSNMLLKPSSEFLISVNLFFCSIFPIWVVLNSSCFYFSFSEILNSYFSLILWKWLFYFFEHIYNSWFKVFV